MLQILLQSQSVWYCSLVLIFLRAVLFANGRNPYLGFHEMAQIVAGARVRGNSKVVLEYQIKSEDNGMPVTYEADIVKNLLLIKILYGR